MAPAPQPPAATAVLSGPEPGTRLRIRMTPTGRVFEARHVTFARDSLICLGPEPLRDTLSVALLDIRRLDRYEGLKTRVHPVMLALAGLAAAGGAWWAVDGTRDKPTGTRILAGLGGGMLGMWVFGTMLPHGAGEQNVPVWVRVDLPVP